MPEALSLRTLNRTNLTRQLLLDRTTSRSTFEVVQHLVAVQGQEPHWPYIGLWARIAGFQTEDLSSLLHERRVVRSTMLRRTVHLAPAEDFLWLRPTVKPIVDSALKAPYYANEIEGMDLADLEKTGRALLTGRTLTRREFAKLLAERYPGRLGRRLAESVEVMVPLVHGPEVGAWGSWSGASNVSVTMAEEWIGRPMAEAPRPMTMILRYLAAFGPAGVMDIQAWSGTTRLRQVVEEMRPQLRVFLGEDGKELFDVPHAPIADPDLPAPVRFLPAFDNAILGYRDRTRMISEEDRRATAWEGSAGVPYFLVDGFVRGRWAYGKDRRLTITPFRALSAAEETEVLEEAGRMLAFVAPDGAPDPIIEAVAG